MYIIEQVKSGYRIINTKTGMKLGFYHTLKAAEETLEYINNPITKKK